MSSNSSIVVEFFLKGDSVWHDGKKASKIIPLHIVYFHELSYHLFSFHGSIQDYTIHMDMEIVIFGEEVKK